MMPPLIALLVAQGLGEYGGIGGALVEGWNGISETVGNLVRNTGPVTWVVIGGAAVLLWLFLKGRR